MLFCVAGKTFRHATTQPVNGAFMLGSLLREQDAPAEPDSWSTLPPTPTAPRTTTRGGSGQCSCLASLATHLLVVLLGVPLLVVSPALTLAVFMWHQPLLGIILGPIIFTLYLLLALMDVFALLFGMYEYAVSYTHLTLPTKA